MQPTPPPPAVAAATECLGVIEGSVACAIIIERVENGLLVHGVTLTTAVLALAVFVPVLL